MPENATNFFESLFKYNNIIYNIWFKEYYREKNVMDKYMGLAFSMAIINILDNNYQSPSPEFPNMVRKRKETDEEISNNCEKIRRVYTIWE